jgi:hypothetical protein
LGLRPETTAEALVREIKFLRHFEIYSRADHDPGVAP